MEEAPTGFPIDKCVFVNNFVHCHKKDLLTEKIKKPLSFCPVCGGKLHPYMMPAKDAQSQCLN